MSWTHWKCYRREGAAWVLSDKSLWVRDGGTEKVCKFVYAREGAAWVPVMIVPPPPATNPVITDPAAPGPSDPTVTFTGDVDPVTGTTYPTNYEFEWYLFDPDTQLPTGGLLATGKTYSPNSAPRDWHRYAMRGRAKCWDSVPADFGTNQADWPWGEFSTYTHTEWQDPRFAWTISYYPPSSFGEPSGDAAQTVSFEAHIESGTYPDTFNDTYYTAQWWTNDQASLVATGIHFDDWALATDDPGYGASRLHQYQLRVKWNTDGAWNAWVPVSWNDPRDAT